MQTKWILCAAAVTVAGGVAGFAQRGGTRDPQVVAARNKTEAELQSLAVVERKVMVPMRDGKRMATDIYRPKDASRKYPIDLRPHSLQLQLLGCAARRAARHDRASSTPSSAATRRWR